MAVTVLPIAVQAPSSAAATSARRGNGLRAAVVAPRPRLVRSSWSHHRHHTAGGNRGAPASSSSPAAATAPVHDDEKECEDEDVKCTWEQLEREVAEESVANVMARNVAVCHPDDSVLAALEMLVEQRLSGVPVVDDDGKVLGVISEYDLLVRLGRHKDTQDMFPKIGSCEEFGGSVKDLWSRFFDLQDRMEKAQGTTVKEAMHEAKTIPPDMLLADAADVMLDGNRNRLCVVDEEARLVGVLSRGDVIRRTFDAFVKGRRGGLAVSGEAAAAAAGETVDEDASDPAIVREALDGAGGLEEMCDSEPDADECKMFD